MQYHLLAFLPSPELIRIPRRPRLTGRYLDHHLAEYALRFHRRLQGRQAVLLHYPQVRRLQTLLRQLLRLARQAIPMSR